MKSRSIAAMSYPCAWRRSAILMLIVLNLGFGFGLGAVVWAQEPEPSTRDLEKGFERATVTDSSSGGGTWYAVCIGISAYSELPSLAFAHNDARAVYDFLVSERGGYQTDHCILLSDDNAPGGKVTREAVERLLTTWMARVGPNDTVFVFFSGHGVPEGRKRAYLAMHDTDPENIYPTSIPIKRIREYLDDMIAAERVVIVMDTCFSGALGGKSYLAPGQRAGAFDTASLDALKLGRGRVILTACTGSQSAHEVEELSHGVFTWCLLKGLGGSADYDNDGAVTLSELWLFLQKRVPAEAGRRGWRQTPVRYGEERGEIVLSRSRTGSGGGFEKGVTFDAKATEAFGLTLEAVQLKDKGFYNDAAVKLRKALALAPRSQRSDIQSMINSCLEALASKTSPTIEGFTYLTEETFVCRHVSRTVKIYLHERTDLEFVLIPGGSFYNYWDQETVEIEPFLICRTECTQEAWDRIGGRDDRNWLGPRLPIERVSWNSCSEWCSKAGLRLPTMLEWEYAGRAGAGFSSSYYFGDSEIELPFFAWYGGNSDMRTHEVGQKKPNAFGLFDVHGNVCEWCQDSRRPGPPSTRINRGGCYYHYAGCSFFNFRVSLQADWNRDLGFRPAASVPAGGLSER